MAGRFAAQAGRVVVYNFPGDKKLRLPRQVYAKIFLGEISSWNDPSNVAANPGLRLPDPEGETSYPITTYTWMLFYKRYDDPAKAATLRKMIEFGINGGQKIALKVGYIPLPENVVARVRGAVANIQL